jgi:predicted transcriptional regulator
MPTLTVRLDDETLAALRKQAEIEHRSMNDVTVLAIQDRAAAVTRRAERKAIIGDLLEGNRELLDKLSR